MLIWSGEQSIRELVTTVYVRLFLTPPTNCPSPNVLIVNNLLTLIKGASIGELTSLEEMIITLMNKGHLPNPVLSILWDVFSGRVPNSSPLLALILLTMAAREDPNIIKTNLSLLINHGLQTNNLILSKWTCIALQRLQDQRITPHHLIFTKLSDLLINTCTSDHTHHWMPLAEQGIILIYKLGECPDNIMENIIKRISINVFNKGPETTPTNSISSLALSRLFFLLGQVAKQQLIHVEVHVNKELKKRRNDHTHNNNNVSISLILPVY